MAIASNKHIILFDGVCNFCNASMNLVIKLDKNDRFRFAPLQSAIGTQAVQENKLQGVDSILLIANGKVYSRSSAALRIARSMGGLYPLLYVFILIPPFIRNIVYDWVARNRYKWFGKKDQCMIPTPEIRAKFIS